MWCGSWGRVAMDFGCALGPRGRGSSGLASAHPWDAGEGQRGTVLGISSSLGAQGLLPAVSWQEPVYCGESTAGTHWSCPSLGL